MSVSEFRGVAQFASTAANFRFPPLAPEWEVLPHIASAPASGCQRTYVAPCEPDDNTGRLEQSEARPKPLRGKAQAVFCLGVDSSGHLQSAVVKSNELEIIPDLPLQHSLVETDGDGITGCAKADFEIAATGIPGDMNALRGHCSFYFLGACR